MSYVKAINDATDEFVKTSSMQNKTILAAMTFFSYDVMYLWYVVVFTLPSIVLLSY